jgi:FkbM family methyltransferase
VARPAFIAASRARQLAAKILTLRLVEQGVERAGGWRVALPCGARVRVKPSARGIKVNREPRFYARFARELHNPGLVVDAGAHWGLYTLTAAAAGHPVVAFEPSSSNADVLCRNVQLSGLTDLVTVERRALWSERTEIRFTNYEGPSWGRTMMSRASREAPTVVPAISLDELALTPSLLKVDVEGAEYEVLLGGERTLAEHRPCILLELHHDPDAAQAAGGVLAWLRRRGYRVEDLGYPLGEEAGVSHWCASAR